MLKWDFFCDFQTLWYCKSLYLLRWCQNPMTLLHIRKIKTDCCWSVTCFTIIIFNFFFRAHQHWWKGERARICHFIWYNLIRWGDESYCVATWCSSRFFHCLFSPFCQIEGKHGPHPHLTNPYVSRCYSPENDVPPPLLLK